MSDEIKKQQVVQFLRNNIQNNNIQPNRQSAIELIDKISDNLDTLGAKDGEPVIVRYLDDNNEIITYMAVVAERNGKLTLSHVTNDIDMNSIIQITESSITSSVSALSGDLSSMIEQTASSITSTVDDKINDTMSVVKQTASSITQSVIDSTNFSTQEQTSELIKQEIGNVLKSVKTYYKLSSSKPSEVNKKDDPIKFGWSETYILKSSKEDSLYSFTRYTYGDGSVIQTEISETAAPEDGATYYTWIRYSESGATSTRTFNDPVYNGKVLPYIGFSYNNTDENESDDVSAYTWSLIKGDDGVPGEPGKTLYTWIVYADELSETDASGKKYPTSAYQQPTEDTKYIGICPNQETAAEGSNWENYSWSRFRGADGVGTTYYTWVKYANELDSEGYGVNISDASKNDDGTYKKYIGTGYNKIKAESDPTSTSTDPKEYTWSPYAPNDSNKYVIVPKDANGLKAIIKADDNIHVSINCYAAKVDAEGVPVTVTDGSIVMYYCDNINTNFREIKVNSDNLFVYTNEKYQEGVHNLADDEEVKSIIVSIFLKNKGTISQDFALDTKTINPSYTSNFLRTETSSAVTQSLINEFGDLSTFKQTASGWTSIVQNLSGDVSTVKQTASSLSSTVQNLSGDVSTVKQTSSALSSTVQNLSGNMSSMEQTVSGINVTVGNIGQNQKVMSAKFTELGEKITNGGLTADTVNTNPYNDNGPRIVMEGGEIGIYRAASAATPNIQFGYKNTDVSGNPLNMMVLSFYDNDGNLLYDLGPGGIMWAPGGENQEEHFTDDEHKIMRKLYQNGNFDSRSNLLMLAYAEYKHLISLASLPTGTNLGEYEYAKKYYAKKVKGEYVDGEYSFVNSDPYANLMNGKYVCKVGIENDKDSSFANTESYYETREYINNTSNIFVIANTISDLENSVFENSLGGGTKGDYYIPLLKSEDGVKGKYTANSPYYELWKIFNKGDYSVDNGDWFYRKDFFVMNTSPTTFYLDISGKNGVTNVGAKYTFTSEKFPIEYKNNTESILNIASDSIGHLYDPIICFTYKDILYNNGTEIVETYYKFHNLSRVYQEFVDGNYNERIDDNNTLYSDKQATFTGDIIYYTE